MPNTPALSVIIPTYNNAPFIGAALESVFAQTFTDYEIIIIDDGSTDNTAEILAPFSYRIQLHTQANGGPSAARNHGLRLAQGEFVQFLDADDLLLPGKLEMQVDLLRKRPFLGAIHSGWQLIHADGKIFQTIQPWHDAPQLDLPTWLEWKPVKLGATLFRREWLEKVNGLDTALRQSEDVDLMLRLTLAGCQIEWLQQPTMQYRHHPASTVRKNAHQQAHYATHALEKFFALPTLPAHIQKLKQQTTYYNHIWQAWHLYRNQAPTQSVSFLQQSLQETTNAPVRAVFDWVKLFAKWSARNGLDVQAISTMWPFFANAADITTAAWLPIEQLLNWWLAKWPWQGEPDLNDAYLVWTLLDTANRYQDEMALPLEQFLEWWLRVWGAVTEMANTSQPLHLAPFTHLTPEQIVQMAQTCIVMSIDQVSPDGIAHFWEAVLAQSLVPHAEVGRGTALFVTYSGQTLLRRQLGRTAMGLWHALRMGMGQHARQAWVNFFQAAWHYQRNGRYE